MNLRPRGDVMNRATLIIVRPVQGLIPGDPLGFPLRGFLILARLRRSYRASEPGLRSIRIESIRSGRFRKSLVTL